MKRRLASTSNEVRIAALSDALKYGQAGLDIVVEIVKTETGAVQWAAWNLLGNKHLPTFTFDVITVNHRGEEISRIPSSARFFPEDLGNGVILDMVSIPGGTFLMGSPKTGSVPSVREDPQHQVTVQPFFMGKYPVTIAQWKAVAALPEINMPLNPNPSGYDKEVNLPVHAVSWNCAIEFCARLAKKTGKTYRLPSEAEWEYACRAGTTTPFHFGERITPDLANFDGKYNHICVPNRTCRGRLTDVGSFPPNAFGLYDMHGNLWEWCADAACHKNYDGAPSDGSVWESAGENIYRRLRGGSHLDGDENCRSATRHASFANQGEFYIGFRVVCSSPWTP
ncbi:formylglycine-generating enzyme family protein [Microseira wollei]|uniref:Sulfatase-modifying factor enzyme-like domain-containing protein n=1 Tax=Microseira wollei NIES-4236 TaxID=2530354 RepID=A0AAV3XHV5_9CYAN|nr:formylglycine-generating enzyme family protein [Microseira wollei]GET42512.1 hypothetical protein PCC8801_2480 [Microseira wollei NIES-4236]